MNGSLARSCALSLMAALAACESAPITGRQQLILVGDQQANQMGVEAYQQILRESRVSRDPRMTDAVGRVTRRIAAVVDQPGMQWQFVVIDDPTPNAFALPGGKVGVHTGMFDVAKTEAQLAAVIGHEIGHVMARHPAERISREVAVQAGVGVLGAAMGTGAQYGELMAQAATLGLVLPFGRQQESEADEIGLMLMARAGYDPREAVALWQNMERAGGARPLEFLSTHPSPGNRIQRLQEIMPRALQEYRPPGR
jgi:predicted Zn-dependent protease